MLFDNSVCCLRLVQIKLKGVANMCEVSNQKSLLHRANRIIFLICKLNKKSAGAASCDGGKFACLKAFFTPFWLDIASQALLNRVKHNPEKALLKVASLEWQNIEKAFLLAIQPFPNRIANALARKANAKIFNLTLSAY